MKSIILKAVTFASLTLGVSAAASAQVYVKVRPVAPVIVETKRPSAAHVWIGEDWRVEGPSYVYIGGRWEAPPHPGAVWVPGHWVRKGHGEYWVPGHWSRR